MIHSAGNKSLNIDSPLRYPTAELANGKRVDNVMRVGASGESITKLACDFSNYGKKQVDVFAPGELLTVPTLNNKFIDNGYGTSFATPIVSGLTALLWSYYQELNYKQIIYCVKESAKPIENETFKPGSNDKIKFSQLSKMGGIVNLYNAINIAQSLIQKN